MQRLRSVVPSTLALVALSLLGGCGGSGDSASETTGSTAPTTKTSAPASPTADAAAASATFCDAIDPAAVGKVAGGTVTRKDDPSGGCSFAQDDLRAPSIGFSLVTGVDNGGLDGAAQGTRAAVKGDLTTVPEVGDGAFVVVGTIAGGENQQAQGGLAKGQDIVLVSVSQGNGLTADGVRAIAVDAMKLAAA